MNFNRKLNGLWLAKHNDGNAWYHIYPFTRSKLVESFHVIRYKKTPREIKGVIWHTYSHSATVQGIISIFFKGKRVLTKEKIDFIVTFNPIPWGLVAWILSKLFKKPIIMGLIGADFHYYLLKSRIKRILKYVLKNSNIVTVTGSDMKNYLIENRIKEENSIFIYPHCIEDKWFIDEAEIFKEEKKYDLLNVSTLIPRKSIETIIEACYILYKGGVKLKLCIVGDGPEKSHLEKLVRQFNLQEYVEFAGYQENILHYLKESKIYVQASISEGFSISLAEAIAAGLVPVLTNAGSERDYILDGIHGLYFEIKNPEDLASKLLFLQNKDEYHRLTQNVILLREKFRINEAIMTCNKIISKLK